MNALSIGDDQRRFYRENGFIKLDQVFSAEDIVRIERSVSAAVAELHNPNAEKPPNSHTSAYEAAFTQVMNIAQSVTARFVAPVR